MKKTRTSEPGIDQELAPEYRFDYSQAKPNRFAEKINLNMTWTVERFVAEEKKETAKKPVKAKAPAKTSSPKRKVTANKASKPMKTSSSKGKKKK